MLGFDPRQQDSFESMGNKSINDPVNKREGWRIRNNLELQTLDREADIVVFILKGRLS